MDICLDQDADLHMVQLIPLPLTISCFGKIQIGFTFLVPAHPGSPGQRAVKWVCVCAYVWIVQALFTSVFNHSSVLYGVHLRLEDDLKFFGCIVIFD